MTKQRAREIIAAYISEQKKCSKCLLYKTFEEFNNDDSRKDGKHNSCKLCKYKQNYEYRERNRDEINKRTRDKLKKDTRAQERKKRAAKKSNTKNIHSVNSRSAKHRAVKRKATPEWAELDKIKILYKKAKWLETLTGLKYHVDHIIPLNNSKVCGLHVWANLQILEEGVNLRKGNRYER